MIEQLLRQPVKDFIKAHVEDDVSRLALTYRNIDGVDFPLIAEQIRCRQKAFKKFPELANNYDLIFPGTVSVEQASSKLTADYKACLSGGELAYDLTGGLGIDTLAFSEKFRKVVYVDADPQKAAIAKHNFRVLKVANIQVINSTAENFLDQKLIKADLIYVDPDRRPGEKRVFSLDKSTPDVVILKDRLLGLSTRVMIKASPMLDISASRSLIPEISEIHVVAVQNECRELLFILSGNDKISSLITSATFKNGWEIISFSDSKPEKIAVTVPQKYIYEPGVALLKAGIQDKVAIQYGLNKLNPSTHLYTSEKFIDVFPGRAFHLLAVTTVDKKELKKILPEMKANLSTKNFPEHVDKLKKKLSIIDGGDHYIFACKLSDRSNKLLITEKM